MTAPLVSSEIDLTDFPYMPVTIARLKQSRAWLICKRKPQLAFYMLNLWMASWHGRPAASLEDDDLVLSDIAMCDEKTWTKIKAEVLRGWVRCDDGRIYHPIVAAHAEEAWARKTARRGQTEAARLARERKRLEQLEAERRVVAELSARQQTDATLSVTEPDTASVTDFVEGTNSVQGKGIEGKGREGNNNRSLSAAAGGFGARDDAYRRFVPAHPRGGDEPDAVRRELGKRLDQGVPIDDIVAGAERYAVECRGRERQHIGAPARWLADGKWHDGRPKPMAPVEPHVVVRRDTPLGAAIVENAKARNLAKPFWPIADDCRNGPGRSFRLRDWPDGVDVPPELMAGDERRDAAE